VNFDTVIMLIKCFAERLLSCHMGFYLSSSWSVRRSRIGWISDTFNAL
jgi:hypothetical protein